MALHSTRRRSNLTVDTDMDDPLTALMAPPPDETPQEAEERIRREKAAMKVSEDIDRELRQEVQAARKKKCVKVLLLGQSESGKSTVLKNFQKKYDPSAFDRERQVWRSVCQLNIVRSFGIILDLLNRHGNIYPPAHQQHTPPISPSDSAPQVPFPDNHNDSAAAGTGAGEDGRAGAGDIATATIAAASASTSASTSTSIPTGGLTAEHRRIVLRLAPLRQIEKALIQKFRPLPITGPASPSTTLSPSRSFQELHVNGYAWQRAREARVRRNTAGGNGTTSGTGTISDIGVMEDENMEKVLCACKDDMVRLWRDSAVRGILEEYRVGMEELNNYFLDELHRIAVPNYIPTDDDILRARLKTVGVTEHRFVVKPRILDPDNLGAAELRLYDVGGARSQRATWMPYFDDVNAIVFLAPMSAFDQTLAEAREVNRLEDTFSLWKNICSSKLLAKVSIVLLLNKRDVLEKKLEAGIRFEKFVKSYGGHNRWEGVAKYLRSKFKAVHREMSPEKRLFYAHVTCATDAQQMTVILAAIEDLVLRRNLEEINLL